MTTLTWEFAESRCGNWFAHIFPLFSIYMNSQNMAQERELPLKELLRGKIFWRKLRKFQNWRDPFDQNYLVGTLLMSGSHSGTSSLAQHFPLLRAGADVRSRVLGIGNLLAVRMQGPTQRNPRGHYSSFA
jgi:hypothetical protein